MPTKSKVTLSPNLYSQPQQDQQQAFIKLINQLLGGNGQPGGSSGYSQTGGIFGPLLNNDYNFDPIRKEAQTQFHENTVPTIAERFASFGGAESEGGQRSPQFAASLSRGAAGLEQSLASLESQYNLQRQSNIMKLLPILFSQAGVQQRQGILEPGQKTFGENMGNWAGQAAQTALKAGLKYATGI